MALEVTNHFHFCPYPVYLDTYKGCTHGCKYCFVRKIRSIDECVKDVSLAKVKRFIEGERENKLTFLENDIPLVFGCLSDPFPRGIEEKYRLSYRVLELLRESQYPVILSTKSHLLLNDEYFDVIKDCNLVLRMSITSALFTSKFESGIDNFKERIEVLKKYKGHVKKLIVRPTLIAEMVGEILELIPEYSKIGVDRICAMGLMAINPFKNSVKHLRNYIHSYESMLPAIIKLKNACDEYNIEFSTDDGRFYKYTDMHPACCVGEVDGFNMNRGCMNCYMVDKIKGTNYFSFSDKQKELNSAKVFVLKKRKTGVYSALEKLSYKECFCNFCKIDKEK